MNCFPESLVREMEETKGQDVKIKDFHAGEQYLYL